MHISDAQFLAQKKIKLFPEPIVRSKKQQQVKISKNPAA
jgi:hypothetical protein